MPTIGKAENLKIAVRVVPNASRNEIVGWMGDELKIKLQAPPEGGRANKALIEFMSKSLRLARREVTIAAGEQSRRKQLEITSLSLEDLNRKISLKNPDI